VTDVPYFSDAAVPLDLLRKRAFNLRWAEQPAGVIPLTAADPDFPACPAVREHLMRYVQEGVFSYVPPDGLPEFREAVAEWMRATRGLNCSADDVFATDSAASAMAVVARACLGRGDEVLMPTPVDFLLQHTVEEAGGVPVRVNTGTATTAQEFIAGMEARLSPHTRMLWLCNPHNPLGVVYPRAWLEAVAGWAVARGLRILSDEIWSDIVYPPHTHTATAALSPEIASNTVTVYGFSKNFALAGLRVGCVISTDAGWRNEIVSASDAASTVYGVSALSQVAVIGALVGGRQWLSEFLRHLEAQRDYVLERLSRWPGVPTSSPQGTYVAFPDVRSLDDDAGQFCQRLVDRARVAMVPGSTRWFGPGAEGHVRICFATSRAILREAFDRMESIVEEMAAQTRSAKPVK
jgi:aspartate/methionine/tyrosine aminotransferase